MNHEGPLCDWFAYCTNQAVGVVDHPIIGLVPTCQRCADRHNLDLIPATFEPKDPT